MDCTKATRHRCQTSAVNRTPTTTARAAQATRYATGSHSLYFNLHLVFSLQGYYPADQGQEDYWQQQPQQHAHQPTYHDQGWGAPQQAASGFPPYPDYGFALINLSMSMVLEIFSVFCRPAPSYQQHGWDSGFAQPGASHWSGQSSHPPPESTSRRRAPPVASFPNPESSYGHDSRHDQHSRQQRQPFHLPLKKSGGGVRQLERSFQEARSFETGEDRGHRLPSPPVSPIRRTAREQPVTCIFQFLCLVAPSLLL